MGKEIKEFFKELANIIIIAFILAMILRTFIIEARVIPTGSMLPTIQLQDRVIVAKFAYWFKMPEHGDVIVFEPPAIINQKEDFIKRVIGLPGDTIEVKDGQLFRNGTALDEPYLAETPTYTYGPVTVPKNCLFVMGDNRNQSFDSHLWNGWLTLDHVKGKAFAIYWPPSHASMMKK